MSTTLRQRRKEARPQELLAAALELFVEKGFAATRSEEIAARAGVSKGTLYLYYPSKEDLLKAVISEQFLAHIAEGQQIIEAFTGTSGELLDNLIHEWWARVGESPASGICKLMMAEVRSFPELASYYAEQVIEPSMDLMKRVIRRGIARQEFREVDVDICAHALVAPLVFLALHSQSFGACCPEQRIDVRSFLAMQTDLVLRGLTHQGPAVEASPPSKP